MTREEAKDTVVQLVTEIQGAKATELASDERLMDVWIEHDPPSIFEELVKEGRLVEVEYILQEMNFRCKSFLLPKSTRVRVYGQEKHD